MRTIDARLDDIVVVDANIEDYESFAAALRLQRLPIHLVTTGEAAVRASGARPATLWMVNTQLPDMSGVSLLTLIRRRFCRSNIFLVGDEYSPDEELAARLAGATAYVCKPASLAWLDGYALTPPQSSSKGAALRPNSRESAMRPP